MKRNPKSWWAAGPDWFALDTTGTRPAEEVKRMGSSYFSPGGGFFAVTDLPTGLSLYNMEPGLSKPPITKLQLPAGWARHEFPFLRVSDDGKWAKISHNALNTNSSLTIINWKTQKVVTDISLGWTVTSLEVSPDGTKLIVGSSNRAIYVFDLNKIQESP